MHIQRDNNKTIQQHPAPSSQLVVTINSDFRTQFVSLATPAGAIYLILRFKFRLMRDCDDSWKQVYCKNEISHETMLFLCLLLSARMIGFVSRMEIMVVTKRVKARRLIICWEH